eukprot:gene38696-16020_t
MAWFAPLPLRRYGGVSVTAADARSSIVGAVVSGADECDH